MDLTPLAPFGVEVRGLAVGPLRASDRDALTGALAEHGVVVLPDQHVGDAAFLGFLTSLGEPLFTDGETPVVGFPDLNVISNVGRVAPPVSRFHTDTSYVASPPVYTALRAVEIPAAGGQTLFTDAAVAWETLPAELRDRVAGRSIRHVVTGVEPGPGQEREAWHPVAAPHPLTGRTALYLSTPSRCVEVSGLSAAESAAVVEQLYAWATRPGGALRHTWAPGDVVVWDNRRVLHRADHDGVVGDRVMHRGMVTLRAA